MRAQRAAVQRADPSSSPFFHFTRTHAPTTTTCSCLSARARDRAAPRVPPPVITPVNEAWSALKDIDQVMLNLSCDSFGLMTTGADCLDASFKILLCFPCVASPPTSLLYEGQTDFILAKPTGVKGMLFGPELKTTTSLFITDERTCCQRMCGCKQGKWTICACALLARARVRSLWRACARAGARAGFACSRFSRTLSRARAPLSQTTRKGAGGVGKTEVLHVASYYQMKDRDGVTLARIRNPDVLRVPEPDLPPAHVPVLLPLPQ